MTKLIIGFSLAIAMSTAAAASNDFGVKVDHFLKALSIKYFGIVRPLKASASTNIPRKDGQRASDLVDLARGLRARILTRDAGNSTDMMVLWPSGDDPTHIITCVEGGREEIGSNPDGSTKYNPAVQRIDLDTGAVETILRGMSRCDGIRRTPWGTVLVTEETSDGGAYEILNPLSITNATVKDRSTGDIMGSDRIVKRPALPTMAWEGLTVLENGVVIAGDELRPGTAALDDDGGAIFKFVPDFLRSEDDSIDSLDESPLVSGNVYAMTASCRETVYDNFPQYGQGCEIGVGAWVKVNATTARGDANANGATGYYRPEDLHLDPVYNGSGIRFCWTNTGREAADNFGEVICGIDQDPDANTEILDARTQLTYLADGGDFATVSVNRFVEGDRDFNSVDNLAFQPRTGILYVIEDHSNGDIFACLPDGKDRDIKSDGCVRILSIKDQSAEPTGFFFSADGKKAYLAIQHSADDNMKKVDDYNTDDVLEITGFRINSRMIPDSDSDDS